MSDKIGEIWTNRKGSTMKITKYTNKKDVEVEFDNGYRTNTRYCHIVSGSIRNPYDKTVYGVGYLGECKISSNNKIYKKAIVKWRGIIQRCYDDSFLKANPSYEGSTMEIEWLNFSNFLTWFIVNYYEVEGEIMCIDKDIKSNNKNKHYSSENCLIVPNKVNIFFNSLKSKRNCGEYPQGVTFCSRDNLIYAHINSKSLGAFETKELAHTAYKKAKQKKIFDIAEEYKYKVPNEVYNYILNTKYDFVTSSTQQI